MADDLEARQVERDELRVRLAQLQERLWAEGNRSLLVILQAMDSGGKDSTIRSVFRECNVQGVQVTRFGVPSSDERRRDFLWRAHHSVPGDGTIGVFNRSHYGAVLVERVKGFVSEDVWRPRFAHINAFERMLADEGTCIVKLFLDISKDEQRRRLQRRLDLPEKHWKWDPEDLQQRRLWDEYQEAYRECIAETHTEWAPWYVVPADDKLERDLQVLGILVDALEEMDLQYPGAPDDLPASIE